MYITATMYVTAFVIFFTSTAQNLIGCNINHHKHIMQLLLKRFTVVLVLTDIFDVYIMDIPLTKNFWCGWFFS